MRLRVPREASWETPIVLVGAFFVTFNLQICSVDTRGLKIDSAFCYHPPDDVESQFLYLMTGDRVILLKDKVFYMHYDRRNLRVTEDMTMKATFILNDEEQSMFHYGNKFGFLFRYHQGFLDVKRKLNYGIKRKFIQKGGPDAAGRRDGHMYVFKGCKMQVRQDWFKWGKPQDVQGLGLPCEPDAAWRDQDTMVILKGDQIWRWGKEEDQVEGPLMFNETYDLKWWTLAPFGEEYDEFDLGNETSSTM